MSVIIYAHTVPKNVHTGLAIHPYLQACGERAAGGMAEPSLSQWLAISSWLAVSGIANSKQCCCHLRHWLPPFLGEVWWLWLPSRGQMCALTQWLLCSLSACIEIDVNHTHMYCTVWYGDISKELLNSCLGYRGTVLCVTFTQLC